MFGKEIDSMQCVTDIWRGFSTFIKGVIWLFERPKYLILLMIPVFLGILFLIGGFSLFVYYGDQLFSWVMFSKPQAWWWLPVYYFVKILLYLAVFMICLLSSLLIVNIISSPIYEIVSVAVEREIMGSKVVEIGILESIGLIGEEIKKVLFILGVSILLLFIPGINVISFIITAFLVGWNFYDYPLARRGWSFKERFSFVMKDCWAVMGFGLWLLIPLLQVVLFPLAVVGGTMLSLDSIKEGRLKISESTTD